MQYAIFRQSKVKRADVSGLQAEHERTPDDHYKRGKDFDNSQIDWTRTSQNLHLAYRDGKWTKLQQPQKNCNKQITKIIKDHDCKEVRKGKNASTVALDNVFTASPSFFANATEQQKMQFWKDCLDWYVKVFCQGDASKIISCEIHLDEKTPHMHVMSVPIFENEKGFTLSAKALCGHHGRNTYHVIQNSFWDAVGRPRGFDRGEVFDRRDPLQNAKRKLHITNQDYKIAQQQEEIQQNKLTIHKQKDKIKAVEDYNKMIDDPDDTAFNDFLMYRNHKNLENEIDEQYKDHETVSVNDLMNWAR